MSLDEVRFLFRTAQALRDEIDKHIKLPVEVTPPLEEPVLPHSLFRGTRGYVEKIAFQINSSYSTTSYDACAVMIRRLLEVLVIEAFEKHGINNKIKDGAGNYLFLEDLVSATLTETSWTLSRTSKTAFGKLKTMGDLSAHSRRYNAKRPYIDDVRRELQVLAEELLYIAGLK